MSNAKDTAELYNEASNSNERTQNNEQDQNDFFSESDSVWDNGDFNVDPDPSLMMESADYSEDSTLYDSENEEELEEEEEGEEEDDEYEEGEGEGEFDEMTNLNGKEKSNNKSLRVKLLVYALATVFVSAAGAVAYYKIIGSGSKGATTTTQRNADVFQPQYSNLENSVKVEESVDESEAGIADSNYVVFDSAELIDPVESGPLIHEPFSVPEPYKDPEPSEKETYLNHYNESDFIDKITNIEQQNEFLAAALVKTNETIEELVKTTDDHEKRISELEKKAASASSNVKPKAPPVDKPAAKPAAAKPTVKPAAAKPAPKPAAAKPAPASNKQAAAKPAASTGGIADFKMVGVYPSSHTGVAPQLAWVTDGDRLIEVTVGSIFDGARVTRIENNTVYTNRGAIR